MTKLSILVVDDEPLARRRLIRMLGKLEWVDRIDEATDAIEAQLKIKKCNPDILLLDIQMPGGSSSNAVGVSSNIQTFCWNVRTDPTIFFWLC